MKRINIYYWILTGLLVPALGIGSVMALMGDPKSAEVITSLGYPAYLSPFLGAARILALIVILSNKFPRLKEWAYAGLVFDLIGAIYSLMAAGNPIIDTIFPILTLAVILGSYFLYLERLNLARVHPVADISS